MSTANNNDRDVDDEIIIILIIITKVKVITNLSCMFECFNIQIILNFTYWKCIKSLLQLARKNVNILIVFKYTYTHQNKFCHNFNCDTDYFRYNITR